ncbi:flagellar protein FlgN [Neobacillus sp. SM06]|uniref:flagellar protein FlgN n=1 Tax=Neobacillus sp. SM06 TaxID=3422492 RepID=UPI003D27BB8B
MSQPEKLISTMEKLLKLHKSLYELAVKKTEIVKMGDMEALNFTLKDEQAHLAAINQLEQARQQLAKTIVPEVEQPSISDCLKSVEGESWVKLDRVRSELLDVIGQIRQQNDLNQKMIYQSLQFVNLTLNLVAPQPEEFNYGPVSKPASTALFNRKA